MSHDIVEEKQWFTPPQKPARLWVDARSTPPRCGAVLVIDGCLYYTDGQPAQKFMEELIQRDNSQIMALEIMAIAVGMSTFQELLRGRKVVIYSDNKGAEVSNYFSNARIQYESETLCIAGCS